MKLYHVLQWHAYKKKFFLSQLTIEKLTTKMINKLTFAAVIATASAAISKTPHNSHPSQAQRRHPKDEQPNSLAQRVLKPGTWQIELLPTLTEELKEAIALAKE